MARSEYSGTTLHGLQFLDDRRSEPTTYYVRSGPLGDAFDGPPGPAPRRRQHRGRRARDGNVAAYERPDRHDDVLRDRPGGRSTSRATQRYFTYLADAPNPPGSSSVMRGCRSRRSRTGRSTCWSSTRSRPMPFRPTCSRGRRSRPTSRTLRPGGIIAFHLSNRYYELVNAVSSTARSVGLLAEGLIYGPTADDRDRLAAQDSSWVVVGQAKDALRFEARRWREAFDGPVLTDDFSDILLAPRSSPNLSGPSYPREEPVRRVPSPAMSKRSRRAAANAAAQTASATSATTAGRAGTPTMPRSTTPSLALTKEKVLGRPLFVTSISISAFLLFTLELLAGRLVLPVFGGTPAVWTTALCFFTARRVRRLPVRARRRDPARPAARRRPAPDRRRPRRRGDVPGPDRSRRAAFQRHARGHQRPARPRAHRGRAGVPPRDDEPAPVGVVRRSRRRPVVAVRGVQRGQPGRPPRLPVHHRAEHPALGPARPGPDDARPVRRSRSPRSSSAGVGRRRRSIVRRSHRRRRWRAGASSCG